MIMVLGEFQSVFTIRPVYKVIQGLEQSVSTTHIRLAKFVSSSFLTNWIYSGISLSDQLDATRFFINGSSHATNMAGRFADGALAMRF